MELRLLKEILNCFMHTKSIGHGEGSYLKFSISPVVDHHRELEGYVVAAVTDKRNRTEIYIYINKKIGRFDPSSGASCRGGYVSGRRSLKADLKPLQL